MKKPCILKCSYEQPIIWISVTKIFGKETGGCDSIDEVGTFFQISMDELISSSNVHEIKIHDNIVSTILTFLLQIVVGISTVWAEHDNWNSSSDQLPPILPFDLCSVLLRDSTSHLHQQSIWLKNKFLDVELEKIDDQFCKLHLAFKEQSGF